MPWQLSPTEFVSLRLGWICHNLFPSVQIMEKRGLRTWYTEFKWIEFTQTWLFCYQATTLILVGMEAESTGSPHLVQQQGASSRRRGNRYLCTPPAWVLCFCPAPDVGSGAQEKKSWICNHRMMHKTRHQTDKIISLNITPFLQNKSQVFTFYNYTT